MSPREDKEFLSFVRKSRTVRGRGRQTLKNKSVVVLNKGTKMTQRRVYSGVISSERTGEILQY